MFGLIALLTAASPAPAAGLPPAGERVDHALISEGFEGAFPGNQWSVHDANPEFGTDTWFTTSYRASAGARSAWSAQTGDRSESAVELADSFEDGGTGWTTGDTDGNYGEDYWGPSTTRVFSGNYSFWSAQVGINAEYGDYDANTAFQLYDSYMNTTLTRAIDVSGYASATFEFWYWMDIEVGYDYFYVIYFDGIWHYAHQKDGASNGWKKDQIALTQNTTRIGFMFTSDSTVTDEGVYVDGVSVFGTKRMVNAASHLYDDGMDAFLTRTVDFTGYEWARVDYTYWLESEAGADFFEVVYYTDGWHTAAQFDGSSSGWRAGSTEVPLESIGVGFRFTSSGDTRGEGVYLDELEVIGSVSVLTCGANVSPSSGVESSTPFAFTPTVAGGLRPLTWQWAFGNGEGSTTVAPVQMIDEVGTFTPTLTLRDQLGQVCTAQAPAVTVGHDVSVISVTPPNAEVVEGGSLTFAAFDVRGHTLDFALSVAPASCGGVSMDGLAVVFDASEGAGGNLCVLSAAYGTSLGSATIAVSHDTSVPKVSPSSVTVSERSTHAFSATDTFGHALGVTWTASCGRVDPGSGPTTTYTASTQGGKVCAVTGTYVHESAVADVTVLHDASEISVTPTQAAIVEGRAVTATVRDRYGDAVDAAWTLEPASCGVVSPAVGPSTTFSSAVGAGGQACRVRASVGGIAESLAVSVAHDWSFGAIEPATGVVEEGGTLSFAARDANGHAVSVPWVLTPAACGALAPLEGPTTTFTAGASAGGLACTVIAAGGGLALRASAAVSHKGPSAVVITVGELEAGASAVATAAVIDGNGHALSGAEVAWTTDCEALSATAGAQVAVTAAASAAGSTCRLAATSGAATESVDLQVHYARPFKVTVAPAAPSAGAGSSQALHVTVTDAAGNAITPTAVAWKTTCGQVAGTGTQATFTAPDDGSACTVSAEVSFDGAVSIGGATIGSASSAPSGTVLAAAGLVAAAAAAGIILAVRRGRRSQAEDEGAGAPNASDPRKP